MLKLTAQKANAIVAAAAGSPDLGYAQFDRSCHSYVAVIWIGSRDFSSYTGHDYVECLNGLVAEMHTQADELVTHEPDTFDSQMASAIRAAAAKIETGMGLEPSKVDAPEPEQFNPLEYARVCELAAADARREGRTEDAAQIDGQRIRALRQAGL